ncbi:hypothetical protein EV368DRAFT_83263 [Lentinula lateritia]|nr:hypothetical protein EV368DRAFT_83263 [Lentinula lateritia]
MRPSIPTLPVLIAFLTILSPVTAGSVLTRRAVDFEVGIAYGDCGGPWIEKLTPGTPTQSSLVRVGQCYAALDVTSALSHPGQLANSGFADEFCIIFIKPLPGVCEVVVHTLLDGNIHSPRGSFVSGPIGAGEKRLEFHLKRVEVLCDDQFETGAKRVSEGSAQQEGPPNSNRKKQRLDRRSRKWQ